MKSRTHDYWFRHFMDLCELFQTEFGYSKYFLGFMIFSLKGRCWQWPVLLFKNLLGYGNFGLLIKLPPQSLPPSVPPLMRFFSPSAKRSLVFTSAIWVSACTKSLSASLRSMSGPKK